MHWKRGHCEILPDGRAGMRVEITEICQPAVSRVVMSGASAACIIIYCTWICARDAPPSVVFARGRVKRVQQVNEAPARPTARHIRESRSAVRFEHKWRYLSRDRHFGARVPTLKVEPEPLELPAIDRWARGKSPAKSRANGFAQEMSREVSRGSSKARKVRGNRVKVISIHGKPGAGEHQHGVPNSLRAPPRTASSVFSSSA